MDAEQSSEDAVGTSRSFHLNNNARQNYRKGRKSKRKERKKNWQADRVRKQNKQIHEQKINLRQDKDKVHDRNAQNKKTEAIKRNI